MLALLSGGGGSVACAEDEASQLHYCAPGPWGKLEYHEIVLDPPSGVIDVHRIEQEQTRWFVPGPALSAAATLQRLGIEKPEVDRIIEHSDLGADALNAAALVELTPPPDVVLKLESDVRIRVYDYLKTWQANLNIYDPLVLETGNVLEWAAGAGLSPETVDRIERLAYREGDTLLFSDVSALLSLTPDQAEKRRIIGALTRTRSLLVRLRLAPDSNIQEIAEYWTAGFTSNSKIPFLEAMVRSGDETWLDITHLLPPVARQLIYTYGEIGLGNGEAQPNCLWTSLNFFRDQTSERALDDLPVTHYLGDRYTEVVPPYQFGDILMLVDSDRGKYIHAVSYIADDIVFTKNGASIMHPWILMKWEHVASCYRTTGRETVKAYRLKETLNPQ